MLDGSKLICKCVNTIVGKDSEGEVYVTLTAFGKSLFDCLFVCLFVYQANPSGKLAI